MRDDKNILTILGIILMIGPITIGILGITIGWLLGCGERTCKFANDEIAYLTSGMSFLTIFSVFTLLPGIVIFFIGNSLSRKNNIPSEFTPTTQQMTLVDSPLRRRFIMMSQILLLFGVAGILLSNVALDLPVESVIRSLLIPAGLFSPFILILSLILFVFGYSIKK